MVNCEQNNSGPAQKGFSTAVDTEVLRMIHNALDLLESCLRNMPRSGEPEPIDLVVQLRRRIIEAYNKPGTSGS